MSVSPKEHEPSTNFVGGQIASHVTSLEKVTSDPWILSNVRGVEIPFHTLPVQERIPKPYRLSEKEADFVSKEVEIMFEKQIIEVVQPIRGEVVSNIFLRHKKDGSYRMIMDLTWLNEHVEYEHFKMTSLQTALNMMRADCWMGSIDLKDTYYSVLIAEKDRKFLRFRWEYTLLQFRVLPNGLVCAPRIFTKLLSPVFASLREKGCEAFPYIDDSFVVGDTKGRCELTLKSLKTLLAGIRGSPCQIRVQA